MELQNRSICEAFSQGNFTSVYSYFSEDIEWHIVGNKVVKGKVSVIDFCTKMLVEMIGAVLTNTNSIEAENQIVIQGKCVYFDTEGKESVLNYCDFYGFENNKIKMITSYCI